MNFDLFYRAFLMNNYKCENGEHHKNMTKEERIDHLENSVVEIIHKLTCVKDELVDINRAS